VSLQRTVHAAAVAVILVTLESALPKVASSASITTGTLSVEHEQRGAAGRHGLTFLESLRVRVCRMRASQVLPRAVLSTPCGLTNFVTRDISEFLSALFCSGTRTFSCAS